MGEVQVPTAKTEPEPKDDKRIVLEVPHSIGPSSHRGTEEEKAVALRQTQVTAKLLPAPVKSSKPPEPLHAKKFVLWQKVEQRNAASNRLGRRLSTGLSSAYVSIRKIPR